MFLEYKLSKRQNKNASAFYTELASLCKIKTQNRKVYFCLSGFYFKKIKKNLKLWACMTIKIEFRS